MVVPYAFITSQVVKGSIVRVAPRVEELGSGRGGCEEDVSVIESRSDELRGRVFGYISQRVVVVNSDVVFNTVNIISHATCNARHRRRRTLTYRITGWERRKRRRGGNVAKGCVAVGRPSAVVARGRGNAGGRSAVARGTTTTMRRKKRRQWRCTSTGPA